MKQDFGIVVCLLSFGNVNVSEFFWGETQVICSLCEVRDRRENTVVDGNDGKNHDRGRKQEREPSSQKIKKKEGINERPPHAGSHGLPHPNFLTFSFQKLLSDNLKTMFPIVYAFRSKTFF